MLVIGCGLIGVNANLLLRRRIAVLSALLSALEVMESEIGYRLAPIPEVLKVAGDAGGGRVKEFFQLCVLQMEIRGPHNFSEIWREALITELSELPDNQRQVLLDLSDSLGRYSAEDQVSAIAYSQRRIENFIHQAEAESTKKGRIYITLGLSLGMTIVMILI